MNQKFIFVIALFASGFLLYQLVPGKLFGKISGSKQSSGMPAPEEGEENEKLRELYNELRHKTAQGVSWKEIEAQNMVEAAASRDALGQRVSFANGNVSGNWFERGANNIAGSLRAVDYVPASNTIYTISNGGSLWSSVLGSGAWTLRNQLYRFEQTTLKAFMKMSGGVRLMLATGSVLYYSDDEGQTLTPVNITYPVAWAGNYVMGIYRLNDGSNTLYCLTRQWSSSPWAARICLHRSTDEGQTFTQIFQFNTDNDRMVKACVPYNSNQLTMVDNGSVPGTLALYTVSGVSVSLANTYLSGLTVNNFVFKGTFSGGVYHLYLMANNNTLYKSINLGGTWTFQSALPENAWEKMNVSMSDPAKVFFGGVNAFRSTNNGLSFTKVNEWSEYYGNITGKLHADIMEIEYFKKTDNTEFAIINCHGGTFVSYDHLVTVSNQSLASHRAVELYDVITDTLNANRVFTGSQDQGLQRTLTATTPGIRDFIQVISGDYGQLSLTNNNNFLWPQYPGGTYYLYNNLGNAGGASYIGNWSTPGSQKPNYGWMLAATSTANRAANEIWIGGGNLSGGGGSYLIKASLPLIAPFTVSATQFPYDFRANSRTATAGITAIEQSLVNPNKLFVATEDGTFFYSNDLGLNWNKTSSFNGPYPWYLYGSCILASHLNDNVIWYSGSGYSNPGVYKSTDGGLSFTAMSNGLPATLVNEIVATPDERYIFAATEAGPYVYVANENQWYSLADNSVPVQFFSSVEYINAERVVRFGTMGRGVWDFKITAVVPVTLTQWQAQKQENTVLCSWETTQEMNTDYFSVEHSTDGANFTAIGKLPAGGNSSTTRKYVYRDKAPSAGINYYRLRTYDTDGRSQQSRTIAINFDGLAKSLLVYPNPARDILYVETNYPGKNTFTARLIDAAGRKAWEENKVLEGHASFSINMANLPKGIYTLLLEGRPGRQSQQVIKQ